MKVLIRADASLTIGSGHLVRCMTLAQALRNKGAEVTFVCRAHPGHFGPKISAERFEVVLLPPPSVEFRPRHNYEGWIGATPEEDASQTLDALPEQHFDWLVVDHYGLDARWEILLRAVCDRILVIDDLADRTHDCDLLLDQNFREEPDNPYADLVPAECRLLLGPRYALLKPDYARVRKSLVRKPGPVQRVLVFFGGGNNLPLIDLTMTALTSERLQYLDIDLVLGQEALDVSPARWGERQGSVTIHRNLPHLADLMAAADLAIGAGGSTIWERMCMGLPSVVVSTADNQIPGCESLHSQGAVDYVGPATSLSWDAFGTRILKAVEGAAEAFSATPLRNEVDGAGCARVVETIAPTSTESVVLRASVPEDVMLYYGWANDPSTRQNSLVSEKISIDTHLEWFAKRLQSPTSQLFVLEADGLPIGQIRFEQVDGLAQISYSLDPLVRGRGLAARLVQLGLDAMRKLGASHFLATVKVDNAASLAVFRKLGFTEARDPAGNATFKLA